MTLPAAGRRVLVTRAAHQAGKLTSALRALGFEPVEVPVLEIRPPDNFAPLDAAIRILAIPAEPRSEKGVVILSDRSEAKEVEGPASVFPASTSTTGEWCPIHPPSFGGWVGGHDPQPSSLTYHWLILTSANTVRALADRATTLGLTLTNYSGKVAAVGSATATAAQQAGIKIDLIPETYVAESLVAALTNKAPNQRILIARAAVARDVIPDALRAAGATVDVIDAYINAIPESAPAQLRAALEQGIAAATFTSSSSVTHLAAVAALAGIAFPFPGVAAISIGPITTQTLDEHHWPPAAEANPFDIPGLVAALATFFK